VPIFGLEAGRHEFTGVVGQARDLHTRVDERPVILRVQGRLWMSSFNEAAELAAQSDRVVVLPDTNALPFLRAGRLVPVGRVYRLPEIEVNLLRPPRHRGAPVLDQLADLLTDRLRAITQEVSTYRTGGPSDNLRVDA
jgi:DNA-binding transcriptional LysR family regulator